MSITYSSNRSSWEVANQRSLDIRLELELLDKRRFGNGEVHLRYRTRQVRAT